jgi:hypothetical protein
MIKSLLLCKLTAIAECHLFFSKCPLPKILTSKVKCFRHFSFSRINLSNNQFSFPVNFLRSKITKLIRIDIAFLLFVIIKKRESVIVVRWAILSVLVVVSNVGVGLFSRTNEMLRVSVREGAS